MSGRARVACLCPYTPLFRSPGAISLGQLRSCGREAIARDPNLLARIKSEVRPTDDAILIARDGFAAATARSEEHTSELQSRGHLVRRLLLEQQKQITSHPSL